MGEYSVKKALFMGLIHSLSPALGVIISPDGHMINSSGKENTLINLVAKTIA